MRPPVNIVRQLNCPTERLNRVEIGALLVFSSSSNCVAHCGLAAQQTVLRTSEFRQWTGGLFHRSE